MKNLIVLAALLLLSTFAIAKNQVWFTPNLGQLPQKEIQYYASAPGASLFFRKEGFSMVLMQSGQEAASQTEDAPSLNAKVHRIDFDFIAPDPGMRIEVGGQASAVQNFYLGHCPSGILNVPSYAQLSYRAIYPGIDIVFYATDKGMKYDIEVAPAADLSQLKLIILGAESLGIASNGQLQIATSLGFVKDEIPAAWEETAENKFPILSRFTLDGNILGYHATRQNPNLKLVVDPFSSWATFYGGNNFDYGRGVTYNGTIYMAGETASPDFPVSLGASQATFGGGRDAYLSAFATDGTLLWTTYLGGTGTDVAEDVATDPLGNIVIAGHCTGTMPVTLGCYQATHAGGYDGFAAQFSSTGTLLWSTHLGGEDEDRVMDLAVNSLGEIAVGGWSRSTFQISTPGVVQPTRSGGIDAMVMKFSNSGARIWGTFFGGTSTEYGRGIDFDNAGNILMAGETYSTNYPTGASAGNSVFQAANAGGIQDMFAFKLNGSGTTRLWSTYIGGATGTDRAFAITADAADNVYVAGNSFGGFPVTAGVIQTVYGTGAGDGAVIKLTPTGARIWASYIGGNQYDLVMSVDAVGTTDLILGGETQSAWVNVNNCAVSCGGPSNFCGFVTHLNANGTSRIMSSILGGTNAFNSVLDVSADINNNIFVTGFTNSTNYPVGGGTVAQGTYGGGSSDAFLGTYNASACWLIILDRNELDLSAHWDVDHAQIQWQSMESGSPRQYTIERAWDGTTFEAIQTLQGDAVNGLRAYAFGDHDPRLRQHPVCWYRIRTTLPNGELAISEAMRLDLPVAGTTIFPNPAKESIHISNLPTDAVASYRLLDLEGREMQVGLLQSPQTTLDLRHLAAGMYLLQMRIDGNLTQHRISLMH